MKSDESSNNHDDSRKVIHPVAHDSMKETSKLQNRNSADGRQETYKTKGEEKPEENASMKKDITGKADQEDVKKEFEIRSEKPKGENEKESSEQGQTSEKDRSEGWRRSYKGDAEVVT